MLRDERTHILLFDPVDSLCPPTLMLRSGMEDFPIWKSLTGYLCTYLTVMGEDGRVTGSIVAYRRSTLYAPNTYTLIKRP